MSDFVIETNQATQILELKNVQKNFGAFKALKNLSLTVRENEVYGFLGRNGSGKSTTIRIAMGISKASQGEVYLFGEKNVSHKAKTRQKIGYVAQEQNFYGWMTPNIIGRFVGGFYPSWDEKEYKRLLDKMELPPTRKIRGFSGGMKAQLGLALALAHNPSLLILDEPTAGLDPVARREFLNMVREHASDSTERTILFSSHLIDEVQAIANKVGIIDSGGMLFEGTLMELSQEVQKFSAPVSIDDFKGQISELENLNVIRADTKENGIEVILRSHHLSSYTAWLNKYPIWQRLDMSLEDIFIALVSKSLKD